jgi:hypothetical protein
MRNIIMLFVFALTASCKQPKTNVDQSVFDLAKVKSYIENANKTYDSRFTNGDIAHYNKMYCRDACVMPEKTDKICGIENILKQYYYNGLNKSFKLKIVAENIFGSKEIIVEEGIYDFMDSAGVVLDKGKFIALWKFENDTLKMYREIWNSNIATKE